MCTYTHEVVQIERLYCDFAYYMRCALGQYIKLIERFLREKTGVRCCPEDGNSNLQLDNCVATAYFTTVIQAVDIWLELVICFLVLISL